MIPTLPYLPRKNEDELLGSWFSRVASANQPSTWKFLLQQCGYKDLQPLGDVAAPNERYLRLLTALKVSYAEATLKMTTLPFWLFFEKSQTGLLHEGGVNIPQCSLGTSGREKYRAHWTLGQLKYCPGCLKEQLASNDGATYWKRSHHLPISAVCVKHRFVLRSGCYSCRRIPQLKAQRIVAMPEEKCLCGADLTKPIEMNARDLGRFFELSDFGNQALNSNRPTWDRSHVVAASTNLVRELWNGKTSIAYDCIEAHFGFQRYARYGLRASNTKLGLELPANDLRGVLSTWGAPAFATLFVAAGVSFRDFQERLKAHPVVFTKERQSKESVYSPLIAARAAKILAARSALAASYQKFDQLNQLEELKAPFWLVYFNDRPWLQNLIGTRIAELSIPSIETDRCCIIEALSLSLAKGQILESAEGARASVRDPRWFDNAFRKRAANRAPLSINTERLFLVLRATVRLQQRPSRVTVPELALAYGTSESKLRQLIAAAPAFKDELKRINKRYPTERIRWKLNQLVAEQRSTGLWNLLREISLTTSSSNYFLARIISNERPEWAALIHSSEG